MIFVVQPGHGRPGWFCMEDYHVFSSPNLTDWTDHGVIVSQDKVPWGNPKDIVCGHPIAYIRKGKYYFYFPDGVKRYQPTEEVLPSVWLLQIIQPGLTR